MERLETSRNVTCTSWGSQRANPFHLQETEGKEQNHCNFSLLARIEVPGDSDRNYQDKYIRESIESSAGSEHIAKIKTSPWYALIPYPRPWRALVDLEKGICDVEKRQKHNEKPNAAIKSTMLLN